MEIKFDIREIEGLSGERAHIYSVQLKGDEQTLLEQFFDENSKYVDELREIFNKLLLMGRETGCRRQWFAASIEAASRRRPVGRPLRQGGPFPALASIGTDGRSGSGGGPSPDPMRNG